MNGAFLSCVLAVLVGQDISKPGPPPKPLPKGSKPISIPTALKDRSVVFASPGVQGPKEKTNLYIYSWKGDYKAYLAKKNFHAKEGWKLFSKAYDATALERKPKSGPVFRQVAVIQNRRAVAGDASAPSVKYVEDKKWITVVLNETVRAKR